jgi:hypothetical protein
MERRLRRSLEDNNKKDLRNKERGNMDYINLAQDSCQWG